MHCSAASLEQRVVPEVVETNAGLGQLLGFRHQFVQQVMELPLSVAGGPAVNFGPTQLVPGETTHSDLVWGL